DTRLRLDEVLGLRRDRIDWQASRLTVLGKGDKDRAVPFAVGFLATLAAQLALAETALRAVFTAL
ncbi:MAG: hypothetical protein KGL04_11225, partial [Elusimicrobia bacterium]|nr:hypothetical protein [Elusimicrobiota bacterium]